jgi:anion-transporting  ArsA/GET3 family ATPase
MDVADFCAQSRVLVVAGKGGVGKTTVTATLAAAAADAGLSVLIVELEGRPVLTDAFGSSDPLTYEEVELARPGNGSGGWVRARRITPDDALIEYLDDHGFRRVSRRLLSHGIIDVVATAIPGVRDILVLGKVKQLERGAVADLTLVDAPATGHAVTFLTSASGLLDAARGGPLRVQATEVVELLRDPQRCRVLLVTLPEEMPVSETVEAAFWLEDQVGIKLGPVVVNGRDRPDAGLWTQTEKAAAAEGVVLNAGQLATLEAARRFRVERSDLQEEQVARLARELPLPQLELPALMAPTIGPSELAVLAAAMRRSVEALEAGTWAVT